MVRQLLYKTELYAGILAGVSAGLYSPANAQNSPDGSGAGLSTERAVLEEVIVTARRREESLQEVPVAVTALGGQELEQAGIETLEDLRFVAPALLVSPSNFGSSVPGYTIRGQRQQTPITPQDTSVVVYFADFALAKPHGTNDLMYDLESVQVLKGPQGTLFGRNTTGGAVLINPNKPDLQAGFSGRLTAEVGNYSHLGGTAAVNGSLTDTLAVRVAGKFVRRDGYTDSLYDSQEFDDNNSESWRLGLLWAPSDTLESYTIYQHYRQNNEEQGWKLVGVDPDHPVMQLFEPEVAERFQQQLRDLQGADFHTAIDGPFESFDDNDVYSISNTTTWEVGAITLKNIIGYRDLRTETSSNYQGTNILFNAVNVAPGVALPTADNFAYYSVPEHTVDGDQWSEEFQILGTALDNRMDWIAGLYYFSEEAEDFQFSELVGRRTNHGNAINKSYSVFSQVSYDLASVQGLALTLGARHTWDDRELEKFNKIQGLFEPELRCRQTETAEDGSQQPLDPCIREEEYDDSAFSWTFSLDYAVSDAVMTYFAARRGYRSGGLQLFTQRDDEPSSFDPEFVNDYEIGVKSSWDVSGVGIRANAAIYRQDYQDIQRIQSFSDPRLDGALTTQIVNAAEATIDGGEVELAIIPSAFFEMSGFVGYVDADYDEFTNDAVDPPLDFSDNEFAFVPKTTAGVQVRGRLPIEEGVGEIWLRGSWYYQDEMETSDQNDAAGTGLGVVPSYDVFDFSIDWSKIFSSNFDARILVKNVTDKEYFIHGFPAFDALGFTTRLMAPPRTVVGQVTYRFGE